MRQCSCVRFQKFDLSRFKKFFFERTVGDVYGKPAVVADTHLIRITNLLGLVDTKDPAKVEKELKALLDPKKSNDFCHRCVLHGRAVCIARRPNCPACVMNGFCSYYLKQK